MCANYEPPTPRHLRLSLQTLEPTFSYAGEAYPGSKAVFVTAGETETADFSPWPGVFGLLPAWARDDKLARATYNARSETVAEKPSFRQAWKARRFCLIPVQSIFEPSYESGHAVRWRIAHRDAEPFFLAGIWEEAQRQERPLWSFSMLTINADSHPLMRRFHKPGDEKRSVVVVPQERWRDWLYADEREARALLQPFDPEAFTASPAPRPARKSAGVEVAKDDPAA
ncbi:SOS response-associated peptidase [Azohydromonas aeria]|uniref:SOS response-associated peptidase n=1 Tax=Azohydromonas aeria TaxID=2590212 RepID=UPI0012FAD9BD|nr:SOS response-associated peptidase family protein [Azohydromonas aeria]